MSEEKEQIQWITRFHVIPPFVATVLGALLGVLLRWLIDANSLTLLILLPIGGYLGVLLLYAVIYWLTRHDPECSPRTWADIRFGVQLYLAVATFALFCVAGPIVLGELRYHAEQRMQQVQPTQR